MDGLNSAKCQKSRKMDTLGIYGIVNDNKTKDEQYSSSSKRPKNGQWLDGKKCSGWVLEIFRERQREHLLSRFSADQTVDFRWNKK